jgi:hypothetical protein
VTYPTRNLDEIVHQRHRLGILTLAAESRRVEFGGVDRGSDPPARA